MFSVEEDEGLAVIFGELGEGAPEEGFLLPRHGLFSGVGLWRCLIPNGLERLWGAPMAEFPADGIRSEVPGDATQPWPELSGFAQFADLPPGAEEGFLGEILGSGEA